MIDPARFGDWVSKEAQALARARGDDPPAETDIAALREHYDDFNRRMLDTAIATFPVEFEQNTLGGVPVQIVQPEGGVRSDHVLLCLHGGAFMWGAGAGGLLEAVPLAAELGCRVVAVEYRLAPEHTYPAAVEDVLAVYQAISAECPNSRIGVYDCSAGGVLTAQAVARMASDGIPLPGAIAMLHGTGIDFAGDLAAAAPAFSGRPDPGDPPSAAQLPYFASADLADPLVMPGNHPAMLAQFPPSLLITATCDFAASACSVMHRRLLAAGVDARLVLFDGLGHAHHMAVELPESRETFRILAGFFAEYLA